MLPLLRLRSKKQALVAELLQPEAQHPRPTYVPADLSTSSLDTVLQRDAAFDSSLPTLFTIEGLVYYLSTVTACRVHGETHVQPALEGGPMSCCMHARPHAALGW